MYSARKLATFRYNFIAGIPGTSSFKFRISRDIVRSVKAAIGKLKKIQTIPTKRKSLYSKMIKTHEISLSKIEYIIRNFAHFILNILLLFSLILSFIILFISIKIFSFKLLVFVFIGSSKLEPLINEFMMPFASITFVLFFSLCVNTLVLHIFIKIF